MKNRIKILDIWVDPISRDEARKVISSILNKGQRPHTIFAVNPEKNFSVPQNPLLFDLFRHADLLIPDGIGIVLAAWFLYGKRLERIPGVEFMDDICSLSAAHSKKVFFFGAKEHVSRKAVTKLHEKYPTLQIAGRSNGYVPDKEMLDLVEIINQSKAEILFIALGSPKQETWYATYGKYLKHVKICQGIGGTLDTIAGNVKRAPKVWQGFHLEWLYRLLAEPKRIKRQKVLPLFVMALFLEKLKRTFSTNGG